MEFVIDFNNLSPEAQQEIINQVKEVVAGGKDKLTGLAADKVKEVTDTSVDFIARNLKIVARLPKDGLDLVTERTAIKLKKKEI